MRTDVAQETERDEGRYAIDGPVRELHIHRDDIPWQYRLGGGWPRRLAAALRRRLASAEGPWWTVPRLAQEVREWIDEGSYDAVVCRSLVLASQLELLGLDTPLLTDLDDLPARLRALETTRPYSQHNTPRRLAAIEAIRQRLRQVDAAFIVSEADCEAVAPYVVTTIVPNTVAAGVESVPDCTGDLSETVLMLVGTWGYRPNLEGLDWFCDRVWPLVHTEVTGARLLVLGRGLEESVRDRISLRPGVEAIGEVEDLTPHYRRAAACVIPTWSGGGSHVKLIESLAHGRSCVATPVGVRGFETAVEHDAVLVGESPVDFANHCVALLADCEKRAAANTAARRYAEQVGSLDSLTRAIESALAAAIPKDSRAGGWQA